MSITPSHAPLVGRAAPLARLAELLAQPGCRVVCVVGPPGIGKTRLVSAWLHGQPAQAIVCHRHSDARAVLLGQLADALSLPSCAGHDPAALLTQVAAALRPLDAPILWIDDMVSDPESCDALDALLRQLPSLRVITTGHAPLALPHAALPYAALLPLPPLSHDDARALFLSIAPALPVAASTQQLDGLIASADGLPLALELLASLVQSASVEDLLDLRPDDLYAIEQHHLLPRSLHAALSAAWSRLLPPLQRVLSCLAASPAAFTLDAAAALCDASPAECFSSLDALIHASWLQLVPNPQRAQRRCYKLLAPLRTFILGQLPDAERERLQQRLIAFLLERADALLSALSSAQPQAASRELLLYLEPLLWLLDLRPRDPACACVVALMLHAARQGSVPFEQAIRWGEDMLRGQADISIPHRVRLLILLAVSLHKHGQAQRSISLIDEAAILARAAHLVDDLSRALRFSGMWRHHLGSPDAEPRLREAQRVLLDAGDAASPHCLAMATHDLGWLHNNSNRPEDALDILPAALQHAVSSGSRLAEGFILIQLATSLILGGFKHEATSHLERARHVLADDPEALAYLQNVHVQQAIKDDDLVAASAMIPALVESHLRCGALNSAVFWLKCAATIAAQRQDWTAAAAALDDALARLLPAGDPALLAEPLVLQACVHHALGSPLPVIQGYLERARRAHDAPSATCHHLASALCAACALPPIWAAHPDPDDAAFEAACAAYACGEPLPREQLAALVAAHLMHLPLRMLCGLLHARGDDPRMDPRATLSPDGAQLHLPGCAAPLDLSRRGPMRRILLALYQLSQRDPAAHLSVWDAFEAGWPGEQAEVEHMTHRVHVVVSRLRQLGLRDHLLTSDAGYRWRP